MSDHQFSSVTQVHAKKLHFCSVRTLILTGNGPDIDSDPNNDGKVDGNRDKNENSGNETDHDSPAIVAEQQERAHTGMFHVGDYINVT